MVWHLITATAVAVELMLEAGKLVPNDEVQMPPGMKRDFGIDAEELIQGIRWLEGLYPRFCWATGLGSLNAYVVWM